MEKNRLFLYTVLITFILIISFFLIFFRPTTLGGDTRYEPVLTGSMEPAIPVGGVVIIKPEKYEAIQVGDIICFKFSESTLITHRVVAINEEGFITKGDANEENDPKTVKKEDLVGKVALILPLAGYIGSFIQTPLGFILFLFIPAVSIILYEVRNIIFELKKNKKPPSTNLTKKSESITKGTFENLITTFKIIKTKLSPSTIKKIIGPTLISLGVFFFIYSNTVIIGHEQILSSPNIPIEEFWRYEGSLIWWRNWYVFVFLPSSAILTITGIIISITPIILHKLKR